MAMAKALLTRRMCGRALAGAALSRLFSRGSDAAFGAERRLSWDAAPGAEAGHERRYRATAQILLLSLPLVRWQNVGGGSTVWRETNSPENGLLRFLEFTGFSNPQRAAGLNRLGFLREMLRVTRGGAESLYFGLMTASPEETAEEARRSLHPK